MNRVAVEGAIRGRAQVEIKRLNEQLTRENVRMSSELEVTQRLQKMILPCDEDLRAIAGLDISGHMEAATEVGGDYFDVVAHHDGIVLGIGDVTGHGLESGVLAIMVQTAIRTLLASGRYESRKFLEVLNRVVYDNSHRMKSDRSLTLSLLHYQDRFVTISGQHEEILIMRSDGSLERHDTIDLGFPLGLERDISPFIAEARVPLGPGDVMVAYTDGITEASDDEQRMYGIERTVESLAQVPPTAPTAGYIERLLGDVDRFVAEAAQADDITVLALTWHGTTVSGSELRIASQLADVFGALDRCDNLLQEAGVPAALRSDMRLVLEELMVNTVEYGYPDGRAGQIRILLQPQPDVVVVELIDDGLAFDPLHPPEPDLTGDLADREQVGGLGIHLARTIASEMRYTRNAHDNHLLLRFIYPNQDSSS